MEMSNFLPELHVAQQSRRDKLRVPPSTSVGSHHFDDLMPGTTAGGPMVLPMEMVTFATSQSTGQFGNINPTRFDLFGLQNGEDFKPSAAHQQQQQQPSCEGWEVANYHGGESHDRRHLLVPQFSADQQPNIAVEQYHHHSNVHNWENSGNELALLPALMSSQPENTSSSQQANHSLSLSLSSNKICGGQDQLKSLESGTISSVVNQSVISKSSRGGCGNPVQENNNNHNMVGSSIHVFRSVGPLGPFTGYTTILRNSKFLRPAQVLLEEFLGAAGLRSGRGCKEAESAVCGTDDSNWNRNVALMGSKSRCADEMMSSGSTSSETYRPDCHEKKAKLLHMQEEVCRRHKQYHQQMQMVMSAFESVPGLGNATPYISRSIKIISRHFRCIKNAIADQLKHIKRALGEDLSSSTSYVKGESTNLRFEQNISKVKSGSVSGMGYMGHQNHVWRPQRGLPERAVAILRAWLFDHFLHPYPTDTDKQMLATQTGLSRNQVSNWFINARVRLWKPMVEEIHMLETKGVPHSEPSSNNTGMSPNINNQLAAGNQPACKQAVNVMCDKRYECLGSSSSMDASRARGESSTEQLFQKRSRMETHQIPTSMDGSLMGFLPYQRRGLEMGGIGAVSLTLGLRHGSETTQHQLQHRFQQQGLHYGSHVLHDFSS